jgi:predicted nucleic acid-binding protein
MPIFYDTNVIIAYVFKWDRWHTNSLNSFKSEKKTLVKNSKRRM